MQGRMFLWFTDPGKTHIASCSNLLAFAFSELMLFLFWMKETGQESSLPLLPWSNFITLNAVKCILNQTLQALAGWQLPADGAVFLNPLKARCYESNWDSRGTRGSPILSSGTLCWLLPGLFVVLIIRPLNTAIAYCVWWQIAVLLTGIGYRFTEGNHLLEENFRVTLLDSYKTENDCFLLNHKTKSIHIVYCQKIYIACSAIDFRFPLRVSDISCSKNFYYVYGRSVLVYIVDYTNILWLPVSVLTTVIMLEFILLKVLLFICLSTDEKDLNWGPFRPLFMSYLCQFHNVQWIKWHTRWTHYEKEICCQILGVGGNIVNIQLNIW